MNRLAYHRVYVAGAMDDVKDGGIGWRQKLTPFLQAKKIIVLDPCNKPIDIGIEDAKEREIINRYKATGNYEEVSNRKVIRGVDLRMVDHSDFVIVHIDLTYRTCGTWEELFWANREKKPTLVVIEQGKQKAPNWLFWTLPHQHIFSSFDELKDYIEFIDEGKEFEVKQHNSECGNRWMFFDWKRLYDSI